MPVAAYQIKQPVRVAAFFYVLSGSTQVPTDPTSITVMSVDPDGVTTTFTATHDSTGNYHIDIVPTLYGDWTVRWEGTGACQAASEYAFRVIKSRFYDNV